MLKTTIIALAAALGTLGALAGPAWASERLQIIRKTEPDYPKSAENQGIEGFVVVRYTVTPEGEVEDPEIVSAIPEGVFERAALKCVREWLYAPPGETVRGVMSEVRFRLR